MYIIAYSISVAPKFPKQSITTSVMHENLTVTTISFYSNPPVNISGVRLKFLDDQDEIFASVNYSLNLSMAPLAFYGKNILMAGQKLTIKTWTVLRSIPAMLLTLTNELNMRSSIRLDPFKVKGKICNSLKQNPCYLTRYI